MNFSNDQYVWLNNHSSSQRRKYGHRFVVLEPHLRRSRINVRFIPRRTNLNHGSNQQKYNSLSEAVWLHHPDGKSLGISVFLNHLQISLNKHFMTQEVSWPSWAEASWCLAAGASWCTRVRSPFSRRFYLYLIFIILIQYLS